MNRAELKNLIESYKKGESDIDSVVDKITVLPYKDLGFARIDTHRELRIGFPEVIFCQGKTTDQIISIIRAFPPESDILATRISQQQAEAVCLAFSEAVYNQTARTVVFCRRKRQNCAGLTLIVSAGTSDLPVAEEAFVTAELTGCRVEKLTDCGIAGIHRLLDKIELLRSARVIIAVAGMEGALPGVIGGLVECPVIAVPTSVGYGASFSGLSALLTMLNSCSAGISVVNIDNGFGAGYLAGIINRICDK